jgi:hypothetical protein
VKVLFLKDTYDILLKITVPNVAHLKRIKRANRFFVYIRNTPLLPPTPRKNVCACVGHKKDGEEFKCQIVNKKHGYLVI